LTPGERELLDWVVNNSPQKSFSEWLRARIYDEAWRLEFLDTSVMSVMQGELDPALVTTRLLGARWVDAHVVAAKRRELREEVGAGADEDALVNQAIERFIKEQAVRLAQLPLDDIESSWSVLEEWPVEEGSELDEE
jgi:hypothetical protein